MRIPLFGKNTRKAIDPVCGMEVDINNPPGGTSEYDGEIYYFCGLGCGRAFQKESEVYISGGKRIEM